MAGTVLGVVDPKKKRNSKEKFLPRKRMRLLRKNLEKRTPTFPQFSRLVNTVGKEQVAAAYDPKDMIKIGMAVVSFGHSSKQVRQAHKKVKEVGRKAALKFLADLHKIYRQQLEVFKDILNLPVCCICLSSTDDFEIRNDYSARQPNKEEEEDVDPAKTQFVKLSNLPTGTSLSKGLRCNCKNTAICMPCFLKLVRVGSHESIRVQCPTCRVVFCFKVGVLPVVQKKIVIIDGIKPSDEVRGFQCPFRIPRIEEDDNIYPVPRHATPSPPPRSPQTPPLSPTVYHQAHSPPPSGIPVSSPSSAPPSRNLRPLTMSLRKRGANYAEILLRKRMANMKPLSYSSSDSDSEDVKTPKFFGDDEKIARETKADRDFIDDDDGDDDDDGEFMSSTTTTTTTTTNSKPKKEAPSDTYYDQMVAEMVPKSYPKKEKKRAKRVDAKKWGTKIIPKN